MAAKLLELVRFRFEKKYIEVSFTKHKLRVLNPKIPAGTVQGCKAGRPEQHREQLLLLKHSLANNSHRNSQKMKMRNSRGSTLRRPQGEAWGGCLTVWLSHTGRADRKQTAVLVGRHQLRSWAVVEPPPKKTGAVATRFVCQEDGTESWIRQKKTLKTTVLVHET